MTYYSQFGEDEILERLFGPEHRGQCVEVGANDGVHGSTTLRLEQLGWHTILIEPNPALAAKLRQERTGQVFECAASDSPGTAMLHIAEGAPHADGVSLLARDTEAANKRIAQYGFVSRPVDVAVRTLDDIFETAQVRPGIDFVSIDVEGYELSALRGCDLDRWRPRILLIEDNSAGRDRAVRDYLARFGYVPFRRTGVNDWYARRDDRELASDAAQADYIRAMREIRRRALLEAQARIARKIPGLALLVRWLRSRMR